MELKDEELERIVRQYGRELLMRAYALLCDWHEAEDTVQDTFAAAYLHRGGLGELERAWLYKVVTNKCPEPHEKAPAPCRSMSWGRGLSV